MKSEQDADVPKFSERQIDWLRNAFKADLRIYSVKQVTGAADLYEQWLFWQGQQSVITKIEDIYLEAKPE